MTLETGEIVSADVIVGADGYSHPGWNTRKEVMEALEQEDEHEPTGIAVYRCVAGIRHDIRSRAEGAIAGCGQRSHPGS